MLRALKFLFVACFFLTLLAALAIGGVVIGLNTAPGGNSRRRKSIGFAGPQLAISGLGGHFPADLKLASLRLADAQGPWLTGDGSGTALAAGRAAAP